MTHRWSPRIVIARLPRLITGLALAGIGVALMAHSGLGLGPWEVFHQGISRQTGIPLGTVSIILGAPILLAWWPLGQRPGPGTVLNICLVGLTTNIVLGLLPPVTPPLSRVALLSAGVLSMGIGSGLYLAAGLGAGPRDGLMTGLHHRFGWSIARARTLLELTVLVVGFILGGTVGLGTLLFAGSIGLMVQLSLRLFDREGRVTRHRPVELDAGPLTAVP
jgi:uncharacterized membrane protein YczE